MTTRPPAFGLPPPSPLPRAAAVLRPVALTIMIACVVLPLVQVITSLTSSLSPGLLLVTCLLAALEAHYAHALMRTRHLSGGEAVRFRLVEYGFYYLAIKAAHIALRGWPAEVVSGGWPSDLPEMLGLLFDLETAVALGLALGVAITVEDVLSDLDRVGEPPEQEKYYVSPLDSLTMRFFVGGGLLLVFSGLARVGLTQVFSSQRPPVTGLVANVLVYFTLGFLMLGLVRLALLTHRWQAQGTRVPPELTSRWVRYGLAFVALTTLVALALPTGYTAGVMTWVGYVLAVILAVLWISMAFLSTLCLLPIGWIMSLLAGGAPLERPRIIPPPPPPEVLTAPELPPWLDTLRTVFVWALVIGMMTYVVYNFVRDRPELARTLRELNALRRLRELWAALRHRLSGLAATARASSAAAWLRERLRGGAPRAPWRYFRLGGASPRDQVRYYYLSLLRRAAERGFGRRPPQTPHEYQPVLARHLPDQAGDTQTLTEAFEETRYSLHPVSAEAAARVRAVWKQMRAALAKQRPNKQKREKDPN